MCTIDLPEYVQRSVLRVFDHVGIIGGRLILNWPSAIHWPIDHISYSPIILLALVHHLEHGRLYIVVLRGAVGVLGGAVAGRSSLSALGLGGWGHYGMDRLGWRRDLRAPASLIPPLVHPPFICLLLLTLLQLKLLSSPHCTYKLMEGNTDLLCLSEKPVDDIQISSLLLKYLNHGLLERLLLFLHLYEYLHTLYLSFLC